MLSEDNVDGKISDERFMKMTKSYETEQKELQQKIKELQAAVAEVKEKHLNTESFIERVKSYAEIQDMTSEIVRRFIEKIYIHQKEIIDGEKTQKIEIVWNFIGRFASPEEVIFTKRTQKFITV